MHRTLPPFSETKGLLKAKETIVSLGGVEIFSTAHPHFKDGYTYNLFTELRPVPIPFFTKSSLLHLGAALRIPLLGATLQFPSFYALLHYLSWYIKSNNVLPQFERMRIWRGKWWAAWRLAGPILSPISTTSGTPPPNNVTFVSPVAPPHLC